MWILLLNGVLANTATLHVAVHRDAGSIYDIAVDGASGQCSVLGQSTLVCPATEAVRFRYGPGGDWVLSGQTEVAPGETGTGFVLVREALRVEERGRLEDPVAESVRTVFLRTSEREVPPPSVLLLEDLFALTAHEDALVRREAVRSLMPWVRHTASDPFPSDAPSVLPAGLIEALIRDPDKRVRRRAGALLREMAPQDPYWGEAGERFQELLSDPNPGVRRIALGALSSRAREAGADALQAWHSARKRVVQPGAPGRAASNGLARLQGEVDPVDVNVDSTLALILEHHPERAWRFWSAWRESLDFDATRCEFLLRETVGLSLPLVRHWAAKHPDSLRDVLQRWEPSEPHSERWRVLAAWVEPKAVDPELRRILRLDDSLSRPLEGSEEE